MIALLDEHFLNKAAVSFFCISGAQDDKGKFIFRSTKNTYIAKAIGTKAENLNSDAALHNVQVGDTVAFELQQSRAARDWSLEPGKETRCGLLATFSRAMYIRATLKHMLVQRARGRQPGGSPV